MSIRYQDISHIRIRGFPPDKSVTTSIGCGSRVTVKNEPRDPTAQKIQKKSATYWSQEFLKCPMSTLRSPRTIGSLPGKQVIASSRSGRWSNVDGVRYAPISGGCWYPATILQITRFGLWKRVDSTVHPYGFSCDMIPTPHVLPRIRLLLPQSIQHHIPGGCVSRLRPEYLSPSGAWDHNSIAQRPKLTEGVQNHGHPKCCMSPGWIPWGGADVFAAAVSAGSHRHDVSVGWNIWPYLPPASDCTWGLRENALYSRP